MYMKHLMTQPEHELTFAWLYSLLKEIDKSIDVVELGAHEWKRQNEPALRDIELGTIYILQRLADAKTKVIALPISFDKLFDPMLSINVSEPWTP